MLLPPCTGNKDVLKLQSSSGSAVAAAIQPWRAKCPQSLGICGVSPPSSSGLGADVVI